MQASFIKYTTRPHANFDKRHFPRKYYFSISHVFFYGSGKDGSYLANKEEDRGLEIHLLQKYLENIANFFLISSRCGRHFLGLPDPNPLVRGMDPDPDPSIIMQK
jgi:hypothetical protein